MLGTAQEQPTINPGRDVASPQAAMIRSINEVRQNVEITLRNETRDTAEVTRQGSGVDINITNSGGF